MAIRNETFAFQLALLCSRLDVVLELTSRKIADSINEKEQEFMLEHIFSTVLVNKKKFLIYKKNIECLAFEFFNF